MKCKICGCSFDPVNDGRYNANSICQPCWDNPIYSLMRWLPFEKQNLEEEDTLTDLEKIELAEAVCIHQQIRVCILVDDLDLVRKYISPFSISNDHPGDNLMYEPSMQVSDKKCVIDVFQKGGPSDNDKSRDLQITPLFSLWEKTAD